MTGRRPARPVRDSFVVHVYRRSDEPGREAAGLVEPAESGVPRPFDGRDELWSLLAAPPRRGRRRRILPQD